MEFRRVIFLFPCVSQNWVPCFRASSGTRLAFVRFMYFTENATRSFAGAGVQVEDAQGNANTGAPWRGGSRRLRGARSINQVVLQRCWTTDMSTRASAVSSRRSKTRALQFYAAPHPQDFLRALPRALREERHAALQTKP